MHLWGFLCVRDAGRRVTKSLRVFLGYSKQSEDLWWCLGMLTLNGMMKKYFMQFLMLLNFLFTAARLFYDLMPSRNYKVYVQNRKCFSICRSMHSVNNASNCIILVYRRTNLSSPRQIIRNQNSYHPTCHGELSKRHFCTHK